MGIIKSTQKLVTPPVTCKCPPNTSVVINPKITYSAVQQQQLKLKCIATNKYAS
jgi:hypothetical protein